MNKEMWISEFNIKNKFKLILYYKLQPGMLKKIIKNNKNFNPINMFLILQGGVEIRIKK